MHKPLYTVVFPLKDITDFNSIIDNLDGVVECPRYRSSNYYFIFEASLTEQDITFLKLRMNDISIQPLRKWNI